MFSNSSALITPQISVSFFNQISQQFLQPGGMMNPAQNAEAFYQEKVIALNEKIAYTQSAYETYKTLEAAQGFLTVLEEAKVFFEKHKKIAQLEKLEPYLEEVTLFMGQEKEFNKNMKIASKAVSYARETVQYMFNNNPDSWTGDIYGLAKRSAELGEKSKTVQERFQKIISMNINYQRKIFIERIPKKVLQEIIHVSNEEEHKKLKKLYGRGHDDKINWMIVDDIIKVEGNKIYEKSNEMTQEAFNACLSNSV